MRLPLVLAVACAASVGCGGSVAAQAPSDAGGDETSIANDAEISGDSYVATDAIVDAQSADASDTNDVTSADTLPATLTVVTTRPLDGARDVALDTTFAIVFSRPITLPTLGDAAKVTSPVGMGDAWLGLSGDGTTLSVGSDHWPLNVALTIELTTSIAAIDGAHLDHAYTFTFETRDGTFGAPTVVMPHGIAIALAADDRGGFGVTTTSGVAVLPADGAWTTVFTHGPAGDEETSFGSAARRYFWPDDSAWRTNALAVDVDDPYLGGPVGTGPTLLAGVVSIPTIAADADAWAVAATSSAIELFSLDGPTGARGEIALHAAMDGLRVAVARRGDAIALAWSEGHRMRAAIGSTKTGTLLGLDHVADVADSTGFGWPWQKIALAGDGSAIIVWADTAGLHRARFDGVAWTNDILPSKGGFYGVAASANGDAMVDWNDSDGVYVARWDAEKKAWDAITTWKTPGGQVHYGRAIALDAVGNALFAWYATDGVHAARFDARTRSWRPDVSFVTPSTFATVALGPVGGMIAWEHPVVTAVPFE